MIVGLKKIIILIISLFSFLVLGMDSKPQVRRLKVLKTKNSNWTSYAHSTINQAGGFDLLIATQFFLGPNPRTVNIVKIAPSAKDDAKLQSYSQEESVVIFDNLKALYKKQKKEKTRIKYKKLIQDQ